jgi:hypothetical protein
MRDATAIVDIQMADQNSHHLYQVTSAEATDSTCSDESDQLYQ